MSTLTPVDKVLCLQNVDVFRHATTEMLSFIASIARETALAPNRTIFEEEGVSDAMYVVVHGNVRLEKEGGEVMTVSAGQSVGTWALFDNQPRLMTARSIDSVLLLKIGREDFYDLLSDHEELTPAMFRAIIERVKTLIPG